MRLLYMDRDGHSHGLPLNDYNRGFWLPTTERDRCSTNRDCIRLHSITIQYARGPRRIWYVVSLPLQGTACSFKLELRQAIYSVRHTYYLVSVATS